MELSEYTMFENRVLSKATGANIHRLWSKLTALHGFLELKAHNTNEEVNYDDYIEGIIREINIMVTKRM
jgi:hypothetical protein